MVLMLSDCHICFYLWGGGGGRPEYKRITYAMNLARKSYPKCDHFWQKDILLGKIKVKMAADGFFK